MKKNKILTLISSIIGFSIILSSSFSIAASFGSHSAGLQSIKDNGAAVSHEPNQYNTVTANFVDLASRSDLYCVMYDQDLTKDNVVFNVAKYIKIEGNKATNDLNQSVESTNNGMLAYLLSKNSGYSNGTGTYSPLTSSQKCIYHLSGAWTENVGKYLGFSIQYDKNDKWDSPTTTKKVPKIWDTDTDNLYKEAENYANNIGNGGQEKATDNTDKDKITVNGYSKDSVRYIRVGPFNWTFNGNLTNIEVHGDNDNVISDVKYSKYVGNTQKEISVSEIPSNQDFYINIKADSGFTKIGNIKATTSVSTGGTVYNAEMWLLTHEDKQHLLLANVSTETVPTSVETEFEYDIPLKRDIAIEKVDSRDKTKKLPNVGFKFQNKDTGKYIKKTQNGYTYVDNKESATEFMTDTQGKIEIKNVVIGTYIAYETKNTNYGYEALTEGVEIAVDKDKEIIPNKQIYVKLSGYVWQDIHSGKMSVRNDLYKDDSNDNGDKAFNGITVRLRDKDGNEVKSTVTKERNLYSEIEGGEYIFKDVLISELENYYVEFEYDGLIYQSVSVGNLNKNNTSKATDTVERDILDKNFASVDSTGENKVDVNGKYIITYNDTNDYKASVKDSSACIIHANTKDANYNIKNHWETTQEEIRYINLGIYEKVQTDLRLEQDLENAQVGVNGYWHVYNYHTLTTNEQNPNSDWNVGVQFQKNTGGYSRAIYQSDIEYENKQDKSKELQLYLTYKIAVVNESSYLMKTNSILEYYSNYYKIDKVGTGLDNNKNITGDLKYSEEQDYNDKYKKATIKTDLTTETKRAKYIYIRFKVTSEGLIQLMNSKKLDVYNTAEINSYTSYKDNKGEKTVAVVDSDSVPGNVKPGTINTYEDDTEGAPNLTLEIKGAREIKGSVFLDNTSGELKTGEIRQGNGIYDKGETAIKDVNVTLHSTDNSVSDMTTKTDKNGNFEFTGYIPGKYTVTYTWGDKTYTVQNYKGTVYESSRNQKDMYWYKDSADTRKTDALDDYNTRKEIDNQMAEITDNTVNNKIAEAYEQGYNGEIIHSMNSSTPTMEFSVEYDTTATDGTSDKVEFIVKNVDFGIVERARQQLDMEKRVKSFKLTLANGQILVDATVDKDGKLQGSHDHVTYMGPSSINGIKDSGFIKAELDSELIEGATVEIGYEIKAINNSELDYMSEDYYKYGTIKGNPVTITPSAVVDYLDKNLGFEADKNADWKQITAEELKGLNAVKVGDTEFLNSRLILYTEKTAVALKPKETASVNLNVSKLLTTSNDLTFSNDTEVVKVQKPGNTQHKGSVIKYFPTDEAEKVEITPSTGDNRSYVIPTIIGITSLVVLGTGIFIIKRKVIDKK